MNKYTETDRELHPYQLQVTRLTQSGNLQYPPFSPLYICAGVSVHAQI